MAAHFGSQIFYFFLIMLLSSPYIEARDGKFFSMPSPAPAPVLSDISQVPAALETGIAPAPSEYTRFAPVPVESDNAYGAPTPSPTSTPVLSEINHVPAPLETRNPPAPLQGPGFAPAPFQGPEFAPAPVKNDNAYGSIVLSPASSPVSSKISLAPSPVEERDNAYGLYGPGFVDDDKSLPKKTTVTLAGTNVENQDETPAEEFNTGSFRESNNREYSYNNYNNYNNNDNKRTFSSSNYNENGDLPYNDRYYNRAYTSNYDNNGFVGRQGMSDTRYMENGKYYYDVNREYDNNQNGYELAGRSGSNGGNYYGEKSEYEFDSMEEYERQQGYAANTQREYYIP